MKTFTTQYPQRIVKYTDSQYIIHINTKSHTANREDGQVEGFLSDSLFLDITELTTDKVIEKFIRDYINQSDEFALINAYYASILGINKNEEKESEYIQFLKTRENIKSDIKKIFEDNNEFIKNEKDSYFGKENN